MTDIEFHVERYWLPTPPSASGAEGPQANYSQLSEQQSLPVPLADLDEVGCLILLGIPGIGKTHELKKAANRAQDDGAIVNFISLASLSSAAEIQNRILDSSQTENWHNSDRVLAIFLDGLDEALPQFPELGTEVASALRKLATLRDSLSSVRLRITCRSAEWPRSLEEDLKSIWAGSTYQKYQLAQFTEQEISSAAAQALTADDQPKFLEELRRHQAVPLASRPITLAMLINIFQQQFELPKRQVDLYRRSLLASVEEANLVRRSRRQVGTLDNQSKLMVIARIATATIFSNSSEIWTGLQSASIPVRSLVLSEIAGGHEPALGMAFAVGDMELRESILTSLFIPIGDERVSWAHQTFPEFLSAFYVVQHGLTAEEISSFLRGPHEVERIPPPLREVAAWIASMRPDFFEHLVALEPEILLRSDVAAASPELRALLVEQLLKRFENLEIHDFQSEIRSRYGRLYHEKLYVQLIPYLEDKTKGIMPRRVAIDIAEANRLLELAQKLANVAVDATDEINIRAQAATAISVIRDEVSIIRLKPLISADIPEDLDDELKGSVLRAIWPEHLTLSELFAVLTKPKNDSFFGAYWGFIRSLKLPEFTSTDAIDGLQWLRKVLTQPEQYSSYFKEIASEALVGAWQRSRDLHVRNVLADFYSDFLRSGEYLSFGELLKNFNKVYLESPDDDRRNFIKAVLEKAVNPGGVDRLTWAGLTQPYPLITKGDINWFLQAILALSDQLPGSVLNELIVSLTFAFSIDDMIPVWSAAETTPGLAEALSRAHSMELVSQAVRWHKEAFYRKQNSEVATVTAQKDAIFSVEQSLEGIEAGNSFNWWILNRLFFERRGNLKLPSEFQGNLTRSPVWEVMATPVRERLISAGFRYISENHSTFDWLGTNTFNRPAAAGYRAFRLLLSERPQSLGQLKKHVWRAWAAAIVGIPMNDDAEEREARGELVVKTYKAAPTRVRRIVCLILRRGEVVARVDGDADSVCKSWADRLFSMLREQKNAFDRADIIRRKLRQLLNWDIAARRLSDDLKKAFTA